VVETLPPYILLNQDEAGTGTTLIHRRLCVVQTAGFLTC